MVSYATLDNALPDDVVNKIAYIGHMANFAPVLCDIRETVAHTLDRMVEDGCTDVTSYLPADAELLVDTDTDWNTVAYRYNGGRQFVFYHHFQDYASQYSTFLVEGEILEDGGVAVHRFFYANHDGVKNTSFASFIAEHGEQQLDYIPFSLVYGTRRVYGKIVTTNLSKTKWIYPEEIIRTFSQVITDDVV